MDATIKNDGHPTRPRLRLVNAFTGWILRTAVLRRLADRQVVELRYTAASGRDVTLPVMYAQRGDILVVLVGGSEGKRWWRHFRSPRPVRVLLRGTNRNGVAHVVDRGAVDRRSAEEIYAARFDIPPRDDPLVVIKLEPAP